MSKLEEPEDHGMDVETHAGLGSADFSTKAQGVRNATDGSAGVHGEVHARNQHAKAKEAHSLRRQFYCHGGASCGWSLASSGYSEQLGMGGSVCCTEET